MTQKKMEAPKKKKSGTGLLVFLLAGAGVAALMLIGKKIGPGPGPPPDPTYASFLTSVNLAASIEALEAIKAGIEAAYAQASLTLAEYQALLDAYLAKKAALVGPTIFDSLMSAINLATTLQALEAVKADIDAANAQGFLTLAEYEALLDAYLAKKAALTGGGTPPPTSPLLSAGALVVT